MIYCEHPTLIYTHDLKRLILTVGKVVLNGRLVVYSKRELRQFAIEFPYSMFGAIKNNVEVVDNLDELYYIPFEGENLPLFYVVPCGKCVLCGQKTTMEWQFRALCECQYHKLPPLFITLTYKECPVLGLLKRDVQLFLKRLRKLFPSSTIRYIACGEYGRLHGRPHYHLLIWGIPPFVNPVALLKAVEDCWQTGENSYNKGFVYVVDLSRPDRSKYSNTTPNKVVGYICKYLRKDCPNILNYKNEPFFISSRRGGIGYQFRDDNKAFYEEHPDVLDISVMDRFTGKQTTVPLPSYFKRSYFKTFKGIVSKEMRDACVIAWTKIRESHACLQQLQYRRNKGIDRPFLHSWLSDFYKMDVSALLLLNRYEKHYCPHRGNLALYRTYFYKSKQELIDIVCSNMVVIASINGTLDLYLKYELSKSRLDRLLYICKQNKRAQKRARVARTTTGTISARVDSVRRSLLLAEKREVF